LRIPFWNRHTRALTSDALMTALGTDMGLCARPGFDRAGLFALHCRGSSGKYFNFADADENFGSRPVLFWLGQRFNLANCIAENHREFHARTKAHPFDLVWYQPFPSFLPPLPTSAHFRGSEVVFMRERWNDPEAAFVAMKGGSGQSDHAHLDLGSFVFDMAGVRWVSDLGPDDYDLPGYWDSGKDGERWKFYRLNNWSHNTLVLNGHGQDPTATAVISRSNFSGLLRFAIVDLSTAYSADAESVYRGAAILESYGIVVQDEVTWRIENKNRLLRWQLMTNAAIRLDGAEAILSKEGRSLKASILSPQGARFEIFPAGRKKPENPNDGYQQLTLQHTESGLRTRVTVQLSMSPLQLSMLPLDRW
jgi:hypothetical protein